MADVVIYTRRWCGSCSRAKALFERKGAAYREIRVDGRPELEREMVRSAGGRTTVPQIFIDGRHVGGADDLYELERQGRLDSLLTPGPGR